MWLEQPEKECRFELHPSGRLRSFTDFDHMWSLEAACLPAEAWEKSGSGLGPMPNTAAK